MMINNSTNINNQHSLQLIGHKNSPRHMMLEVYARDSIYINPATIPPQPRGSFWSMTTIQKNYKVHYTVIWSRGELTVHYRV